MADFREIVSPGDAFSQGFEGLLFHQQQQRRQAMLDEIAAKREARLEEADRLDNELRRQSLQQKMAEDRAREAEHFVDRYQKTHVAGDIPDMGTLTKAKDLGVEDMFREQGRVQAPPSHEMELPGAMPVPGSDAPPVPMRLAPSPSEAALPGKQTFMGSAKEQELATQRQHAQTLLDALPEGPEKEGIKFWLATGKEPPAGLLTGGRSKVPELGTFGDQLYRISGGHPENLTAEQVEKARKKWGEEGRAPQQPINIFTRDENGNIVPAPGQHVLPPHSRVISRPVTAGDVSKLTPAQLVVFKDVKKRKEDEAKNFLPALFGSGIDDETEAEIDRAAMAAALAVGSKPGVAPAAGAADPSVQAILDKLNKR